MTWKIGLTENFAWLCRHIFRKQFLNFVLIVIRQTILVNRRLVGKSSRPSTGRICHRTVQSMLQCVVHVTKNQLRQERPLNLIMRGSLIERVHLDILGPLNSSEARNNYYLNDDRPIYLSSKSLFYQIKQLYMLLISL